jgi:hypothetical protein
VPKIGVDASSTLSETNSKAEFDEPFTLQRRPKPLVED